MIAGPVVSLDGVLYSCKQVTAWYQTQQEALQKRVKAAT